MKKTEYKPGLKVFQRMQGTPFPIKYITIGPLIPHPGGRMNYCKVQWTKDGFLHTAEKCISTLEICK